MPFDKVIEEGTIALETDSFFRDFVRRTTGFQADYVVNAHWDWFTKYITLTQFYLFYPNYDQLLVYYWLFIHRFPRYNTMILYFSHNEDIFDGSSENLESRAAFLGLHQPKIKYLWLKQQQQFDHFLKLPKFHKVED
mgnify:CR=1 FL=1